MSGAQGSFARGFGFISMGFAALSLFAACAKSPSSSSVSSPQDPPNNRETTVKRTLLAVIPGKLIVSDPEGRAIAGAKLQIGESAGQPFAGNIITTDANGWVNLPKSWTSSQPVTIEAPGFVRATYLAHKPEAAIFKLRRQSLPKPLWLQGQTTGYGLMPRNGTLDVSLVFAAIPRAEVATFELTQLIGTSTDAISVYGETLYLPSSLSVPAQSESYSILPVNLNKPMYRIGVPAAGDRRIAAVHGQFDFSATINDMRAGKSFFDVINRIQFRSVTTRDYSITLPAQSADLPLGETPFQALQTVTASGLPAGYAMLATMLTDKNGLCVVTDVKRLLEGERRTLMGAGSSLLMRTLKKYDSQRTDFSGADYEEASSIVGASNLPFLPVLKPIVTVGRKLRLTPPMSPTPLPADSDAWADEMTYVTLSRVQPVQAGDLTLVEKADVWDFYADGFSDEVTIPVFDRDPWGSAGRYRWELRYGATAHTGGAGVALSFDKMGAMSHISKTAVDFTVF